MDFTQKEWVHYISYELCNLISIIRRKSSMQNGVPSSINVQGGVDLFIEFVIINMKLPKNKSGIWIIRAD